jgi:hypothetical protein
LKITTPTPIKAATKMSPKNIRRTVLPLIMFLLYKRYSF